jgi:membrane carboxypeptidase/penicillin-binding protein
VLSPGVAYEVTQVLQQNVQYGTGVAANFGRPAAGKTGTTDNHADAWFSGYTPDLETTVWVGYPRAEIPMENVHGIAVTGGTFPAEIWHGFMQSALANRPVRDFSVPSELPAFTSWHGQWQWSGQPPSSMSTSGYYAPTTTTTYYTTTG